jgi:hypothetical protein
MSDELDGREPRWEFKREVILFALGVGIIVYTVVIIPFLKQEFHPEYLIAGVALCGVSVTSLGDKKK